MVLSLERDRSESVRLFRVPQFAAECETAALTRDRGDDADLMSVLRAEHCQFLHQNRRAAKIRRKIHGVKADLHRQNEVPCSDINTKFFKVHLHR